ncbi:hypothetical protein [Agrococcus sp. ARC_14]|uniref:hypothetical protein n=1 Tax=Agrococcus sp. ARC_14 TaxID=2919927 RepID=UPI001F059307|nr:hypothetical protein [Agrococcus sp. ARC_14]MCH1883220.1 hypothetical protein [Agrococcus sp. ARC_14]
MTDSSVLDESGPWRQSLWTMAAALERRISLRSWRPRTGYLVERDIVLGAFSIRKLIESEKCSTLLPHERLSAEVHPLTGPSLNPLDRWTFWEYYSMERGQKRSLTVREFCNVVVHSFVLDFAPDSEHGPATLWVVSDRERDKHLYSIALRELVTLFRRVASEDVVRMRIVREQGRPPSSYRLSQHDLVDAGLAAYIEGAPGDFDWDGDERRLELAFPAMRRNSPPRGSANQR